MEMLVLDDHTASALVADRERLGLDRYDEVHVGRYVINPAPNQLHAYIVIETAIVLRSLAMDDEMAVDTVNVGTADDYRVTDVGVVEREPVDGLWLSAGQCRVAVEVLSPQEHAGSKVDHYRDHGVQLYLEIDPLAQTVTVDLDEWHHAGRHVATQIAAALGFGVR